MLLPIPDILTAEQVFQARQMLEKADWVDGRVTAGRQSAMAKDNRQLPEGSPAARELGAMGFSRRSKAIRCLFRPHFRRRVFPPLFNRYRGGQSFGTHVDNAIRQVTGTPHRIPARISPRRCSSRRRMDIRRAGNWWWKTRISGTHEVKPACGPYGALSGDEFGITSVP